MTRPIAVLFAAATATAAACAPAAPRRQLHAEVRATIDALHVRNTGADVWTDARTTVNDTYSCPGFDLRAGETQTINLRACLRDDGGRFVPAAVGVRRVAVVAEIDAAGTKARGSWSLKP